MAKRGQNIYCRKDGRWEGRIKNPMCRTQKNRTAYIYVYGHSYEETRQKMDEVRSEMANNITPCSDTFGKIASIWFDNICHTAKGSTCANYNMKLQKHILPYFSAMRYEKVSPEDIARFSDTKAKDGLSASYISDIITIIKSIAKFARKQFGYVNRLENISRPKQDDESTTEKKILSDDEFRRLKNFLEADATSSNVGIMLAASTGIRLGELCALKWGDIDFKKNILTVRHTVQRISNINSKGTSLVITSPKSSSSRRVIPLPDHIIPYLKAVRKDSSLYLLSGTEKPAEPRTMQYRFKSILKKCNLPYVTFHSLRHMFATFCASLGVEVKVLSTILGHSSVEITLNRYVHAALDRKRECMRKISEKIFA